MRNKRLLVISCRYLQFSLGFTLYLLLLRHNNSTSKCMLLLYVTTSVPTLLFAYDLYLSTTFLTRYMHCRYSWQGYECIDDLFVKGDVIWHFNISHNFSNAVLSTVYELRYSSGIVEPPSRTRKCGKFKYHLRRSPSSFIAFSHYQQTYICITRCQAPLP